MDLTPIPNDPFRHFFDLGYRRLVPITPPGAPVHPGRLARAVEKGRDVRGKAPGVLQGDAWRGMDHTRMECIEADLDAWRDMGAGVGIRTGNIIAVDVDVMDEALAARIVALARDVLGPAPVRYGRRPKALLVYRTEEAIPYEQVRFETGGDEPGLVEILSEGRYFVAHGTHPGTGRPYEWPDGVPRAEDLTFAGAVDVRAFLEAVEEIVEAPKRLAASAGAEAPTDQRALLAPSMSALRSAVAALPNRNDDFPTRESWIEVGYAIKASCPIEEEDAAFDLWMQWSGRWDGGEVDVDDAQDEWRRMKAPYRRGASWVMELAEKLGGWTGRAEAFFEPIPVDDPAPESAAGDGLYEMLTIDDLMALPRPRFLIDRHLPAGAMGFLYGEPGSRKSFLALSMALSIAYGLPDWQGDAIDAPEDATVLYIAYEGVTGYRARIRAWQEATATPVGRKPRFVLIRHAVNFMRVEDVVKLVKTVRAAKLGKLALIVVDTVSRAMPGADENLQKDMTLFVKACGDLQRATGATVMGVHHATKGGETMRGSGVLQGAGDFVLRVEKLDGGVGRLTAEKQKDAEDGWSDIYAFPKVRFGDEGEDSLVPERLASGAGADAKPIPAELAERIMAAMQQAWEAGAPWGKTTRTGDRFAPAVIARDFGLGVRDAEAALEMWAGRGLIAYETACRRTKRQGWRRAEAPPMPEMFH